MNKFKKVAIAAVSVVMAGTMAMSMAACNNNNDKKTMVDPKLDDAGKLVYAENTSIPVMIGYNNAKTGITYNADNITTLGADTKLAGSTQSQGTLKPAWAALEKILKIKFNDKYDGTAAGAMIGAIKNNTADGGLAGVAAFTASADTITSESVNGTLLNINEYIEYMPNYKAFLDANPIVQASLVTDTSTGAMYMIPYFDGNDDVEKYVLMRKDIVEDLLDSTTVLGASGWSTFKSQADAKTTGIQKEEKDKDDKTTTVTVKPGKDLVSNKASVKSFMGTTGSYKITTTDKSVVTTVDGAYGNNGTAVSSNATVTLVVDYDAAKTAVNDANSNLGKAVRDAYASVGTLDSGNIVDIQNAVIDGTAGAVKGSDLLNILREYIKVAYHKEGETACYYDKLSDVFNSAYAAWDVDLYVALGRAFVASGTVLGDKVNAESLNYLLAGRAYTTQRTNDVVSLAGELYGVRGLESRYNYTYIDADGTIKDARSNEATYDAMNKLFALAQEGLLNTSNNVTDSWSSVSSKLDGSNKGIFTMSQHDYVQTQTAKYGFKATDASVYNYAPIVTPVSKWKVGTTDTVMRFTESWRGVKDGGIAISKEAVKNDADLLSAVLAFVDYCYSSDGQILMTYGPQSTTGNTNPNGTWYATEAASSVTLATIADQSVAATSYAPAQYKVKDAYKGQYFVYAGKIYTGTFYNGRQIPTMTTESYNIFTTKGKYSFTGYARELLGATLPVWNKDQGFEYQCTAACGLAGSDIWAIANVNGTIKHQVQTISSSSYWYTLVPTQLPYTSLQTTALGSGNLAAISGKGGSGSNLFVSSSSTQHNLLLDIMYYGYDTTHEVDCVKTIKAGTNIPANAAGCVQLCKDFGLETLLTYKTSAWGNVKTWYSALTA